MTYRADFPSRYSGESVGSGQCVAFVQRCTDAPLTKLWTRGQQVKGADVPVGTAIATFDPDGTYGNREDGTSHAAIYVAQDAHGIVVWDQWVSGKGKPPQPVHLRMLPFAGLDAPDVHPCNNGDYFYVVETAS